jgi:hypothetical protein
MRQIVFKVGFVAIPAALIAFVVADYLAHPGPSWVGGSGGPSGPDPVLHNRTNAVLNAVRIKPEGAQDDPVAADPGEQVDFVYRLENRTERAVEGLKVEQPSCCFQIVRDLPVRLPAGGAAEFGFRVRSPIAGMSEKRVPVFTSVRGAPAAVVLRVAVRANAKAPRLIDVPEDVRLSAIRGDPIEAIVKIRTVEARNATPFVSGLEVQGELADAVGIGKPEQTGENTIENLAVLVCYSFKLSVGETQSLPRTASGYLKVRTTSLDGQDDRLIPLYATLLDPVTVVPEEVVLAGPSPSSSETKRVIVVNRRPEQDDVIEVKSFDDTVLEVRPVGAAASDRATFEVGPASGARTIAARESLVVFKVGTKEVSLTVRFAAPAPSEGPAP